MPLIAPEDPNSMNNPARKDAQHLLIQSRSLLESSQTGRSVLDTLRRDDVQIEVMPDETFSIMYRRYGKGVRIRAMQTVATQRGSIRHSGQSVFVLTRSLLNDPTKTALMLVYLAAQHLYDDRHSTEIEDLVDRTNTGGVGTGQSERWSSGTTRGAAIPPRPVPAPNASQEPTLHPADTAKPNRLASTTVHIASSQHYTYREPMRRRFDRATLASHLRLQVERELMDLSRQFPNDIA